MADYRPATPEQHKLLSELLDHRLLIETAVPGLYGRGGDFEAVCESFSARVTRAAMEDRPERMSFPPILPRASPLSRPCATRCLAPRLVAQ